MEETGRPLDEATRVALGETHPGLVVGRADSGVEEGVGGLMDGVRDGGAGGEEVVHVLDPAMRSLGVGRMEGLGTFAVQPGLGEGMGVEQRVETELGGL